MWSLTVVPILTYLVIVYGECNYNSELELGTEHYLYSPEYPYRYPPDTQCSFRIGAPFGYRINFTCNYEIPSSANCKSDSLSISLTGRTDMVDGLTFCGNGTVERNSVANRMFVRLRSTSSSPGGTLICRMRAILQNCTSGRKNNMRIVNGAPAMINEFPMMAALVDARTRAVFCGAVIVAERYALTTAYCLQGRTISETALLVGDHDLSTGAKTMYAQLYVVAEFLKHPGFSMHPIENDIALLRTVQPIQYNPGVGPVCLPWKYRHQDFDGAVVEACGWGNLDFGGPQSEVLQKVSLDVISNQHCSELLNSSISNEKMCTYTPSRDVCQSDYGGPLFFTEPQSGAVYDLGIISYGLACAASEPSVNTRLTEYLDWIVTNSPNTFYCVK